jgi:hypothetical protein
MREKTSGTRRTNGGAAGGTRVALAVGVLFAVAGCTAPRYAGYGPPLSPDQYKQNGAPNPNDPYTFDIVVDNEGCPSDASMEEAYRKCPDRPKDCVRVKGGQTVQFRSPKNDFVLQFDPFGKTAITAGGNPVVLPTEKNEKLAKPYTFTIRGTGDACKTKVVDPQLILD